MRGLIWLKKMKPLQKTESVLMSRGNFEEVISAFTRKVFSVLQTAMG
jgi:hypothetical protein